jgi:hypothetical protein
MPSPTHSELLTLLAKFRRDAEKRDGETLRRLSAAYQKLYKRLSSDLELEARRIWDSKDTVSRVYLTNRLSDLFTQVEDELNRYQGFLKTTVELSGDAALTAGTTQATELMKLATLGRKAIISVDFNQLPVATINTMIAFLAPDSPLYKRIDLLAKYHAPIVRDNLVEAIAKGYNPYKTAGKIEPYLKDVANQFQVAMANPFADAVRMARTAQIKAEQEATRANYQANGDVVDSWQWFAEVDGACPSCLAMHGTIHPLDESLDDHHNGRCTAIPVVLGNAMIDEGAGEEWFNKQDEATQQSILGKGAWQAYQDGKFDFSQLSKITQDDVYGELRTVTPLKDLIDE